MWGLIIPALPTDRQYTGQRVEGGLGGVYHYHARWYDPLIGKQPPASVRHSDQ